MPFKYGVSCNMKRYKYTKEELIEAIESSTSYLSIILTGLISSTRSGV